MISSPRSALPALLIPLTTTAISWVLLSLLDRSLSLPSVQCFDRALQLRAHALATPNLDSIFLAFTWLGAIRTFAAAAALVVAWLVFVRRLHIAALFAGAITGALLLNEATKLYFHRPRPHLPWSIGDEQTWSFPSGHSLFSVVLYGTLAWVTFQNSAKPVRRVSAVALAIFLPLAIGFSRIYLGMHYPTDVLAGYIEGSLWLLTVILLDRRFYSA